MHNAQVIFESSFAHLQTHLPHYHQNRIIIQNSECYTEETMKFQFPKDFLFGAACSACQTESGCHEGTRWSAASATATIIIKM